MRFVAKVERNPKQGFVQEPILMDDMAFLRPS